VEEPVQEMLPHEEISLEKRRLCIITKKLQGLPQDVALWPSVIMDAFVTECIDRGPDYFQNRDPGKYPLCRRHYP
jgi:hypothetical protein